MRLRLSIGIRSQSIGSSIQNGARKAIRDVERKLPSLVRGVLEEEAEKVLGASARVYKAGLQVSVNRGGIVVRMARGLPEALETGFDQFDIKPGLLARARKFSKTGEPYIDVPLGASRSGMSRARSTIRRLSARSDPGSWIHPGFKGVKAFERMGTVIEQRIQNLFTEALGKVK